MKMPFLSRGSAFVLSVFCLTAVLNGADAKLPPARELIDKHLKLVGGKEAMLKTSFLHGKGRFEIPSQNISGDFEYRKAKPNKQVVRVVIGQFGEVNTGFDGTTGWSINPMTGGNILTGQMLDQAREEAEFYRELHEDKNFNSMETTAKAPFEGKECYQVKLVWKSGRETTEYYDAKTGFLIGFRSVQATPAGSVEIISLLEDYKKFGELLHPTKLTQKMGDLVQIITVQSVTTEPIPDSEFVVPASLKK